MNNKFFVSLDVAKLLKEKGYDEECDYVIDDDGDILLDEYHMNQDLLEWEWSCPTKSEVIDWLEGEGIVVIVDISLSDETWIYSIYREGEHVYDSIISKESYFQTRLEAQEAAIIKVLTEFL